MKTINFLLSYEFVWYIFLRAVFNISMKLMWVLFLFNQSNWPKRAYQRASIELKTRLSFMSWAKAHQKSSFYMLHIICIYLVQILYYKTWSPLKIFYVCFIFWKECSERKQKNFKYREDCITPESVWTLFKIILYTKYKLFIWFLFEHNLNCRNR